MVNACGRILVTSHTIVAPVEPAAPEMKRAMITVEIFCALNEMSPWRRKILVLRTMPS